MTKVASLGYEQVVKALQRCGFVVVRQRGSHIRPQKHTGAEVLKIIVPAHQPIKRSTLATSSNRGASRLMNCEPCCSLRPKPSGMPVAAWSVCHRAQLRPMR